MYNSDDDGYGDRDKVVYCYGDGHGEIAMILRGSYLLIDSRHWIQGFIHGKGKSGSRIKLQLH